MPSSRRPAAAATGPRPPGRGPSATSRDGAQSPALQPPGLGLVFLTCRVDTTQSAVTPGSQGHTVCWERLRAADRAARQRCGVPKDMRDGRGRSRRPGHRATSLRARAAQTRCSQLEGAEVTSSAATRPAPRGRAERVAATGGGAVAPQTRCRARRACAQLDRRPGRTKETSQRKEEKRQESARRLSLPATARPAWTGRVRCFSKSLSAWGPGLCQSEPGLDPALLLTDFMTWTSD